MANKLLTQLAQELKLTCLGPTGGTFGGVATVGILDGHPVAISWIKIGNQASLQTIVRFQTGSLGVTPQALAEEVASSSELLAAMGRRKLSGAERKKLIADDGALLFVQIVNFRGLKPEPAAATIRCLVSLIARRAKPVGPGCETCSASGGDLYLVDTFPKRICAGCRERMGEEDRRRIDDYAALPSNPGMGTIAGVATAACMALAWGGVAYGLERIFLFAAILMGLAVAWAVNRGMGKINLYGRILTVALTPLSVLAGDYVFFLLGISRETQQPITGALASLVADHFVDLEFRQSSGAASLIFGLIGAGYVLFINRPPIARRTMVAFPMPAEAASAPGYAVKREEARELSLIR